MPPAVIRLPVDVLAALLATFHVPWAKPSRVHGAIVLSLDPGSGASHSAVDDLLAVVSLVVLAVRRLYRVGEPARRVED